MNGRKRTVQIKFRVTEAERDLILEKMKLVPTRNMAAYLRKIAIDGYIIQIDHADIKAMTAEIQKIGVNVNQIARRVNATGNAYQEDIEEIKGVLAEIWRLQRLWTQAIYNAFNDNICEYDDEVLRSKEKEIIDRIAVVNVKKSNGGSESEYEDLKKYALEDRLEIKRELEIIQPDIIVCGNNLSLLKLVLGEELQNDDTWDNMLALWKDTLVLDYYHPAVHYPNRVNYYALMAICDVARKKYGTPVWSEQNEKY